MPTPSRQAKKQRSDQVKAVRLARARRARRIKSAITVLVIVVLFGAFYGILKVTDNTSSSADSSADSTDPTADETTTPPPAVAVVPAGATITGVTPCPPADGSAARASTFAQAPPTCIDPSKKYSATFDTTQGKIVVALDATKAPITTNNFVVLSRYHYYDGSAIVRTNTGIDIVQGGAPATQTNADQGPGYTITDDPGKFTYADGDLVMANTGSPNTSGGQFFFGAGANVSQLDTQGTYLNFGKVTEGLDVLHAILALHVPSSSADPTEGFPSTAVIVNKVTITES